VKSQPSEGTTFEIYLPKAAATDDQMEKTPAPAPKGNGERILFVDDDQSVRDMACASLNEHGYEVLPAASGVEALAELGANPDAIDLVLLDHEMPGVDGPAVLRAIRSSGSKAAVVLMSGNGPETKEQPVASEAFLAKPFTLDELLRVVSAALRGR
jgi:two-component system, cell cycle sensor histidine kinase and response regulator CckA